jgi:glutathione S-transferase
LLTLFGSLDSGNVHKAQMILRRAGQSYRRVDVAQTRGEPRDRNFLAVNPMGKVPAVLREEDGRVMTESGAILYYFSQGTSLWPGSLDDRTEVLRWMFFEQYSHEPTLAVMRSAGKRWCRRDAHLRRVFWIMNRCRCNRTWRYIFRNTAKALRRTSIRNAD